MGSKLALCLCLSLSSLVACGDGDSLAPREACDQLVEATCGRFYACLTAAEISAAGLPPTEAQCITQRQTQLGCAAQTVESTCDTGETYHADKAGACVDEFQALECAQIRDPNLDLDTAAPSCGQVCTAS